MAGKVNEFFIRLKIDQIKPIIFMKEINIVFILCFRNSFSIFPSG